MYGRVREGFDALASEDNFKRQTEPRELRLAPGNEAVTPDLDRSRDLERGHGGDHMRNPTIRDSCFHEEQTGA